MLSAVRFASSISFDQDTRNDAIIMLQTYGTEH
jgi:hypothetical protein